MAALAEGAAAAGHEVRVVAAIRGRTVRPSRPDRPERQAGVEVLRVRTWGLPWSQPLAPGYLSAARWPADIVYVHRPHPLADLAALRGPGRHLIVFHHADVQRQRLLKMFYQPLAHRVAARAAAAVVGARANLDHADDLGAAGRSRAVVIPFGVDAHRFAPPGGGQSPPERPEGFPASGPVGLFVGRLVSYKGLDVLLDAVAGTPELQVVVVGDGPRHNRLVRRARECGVLDRFRLVGEVAADHLPDWYRAADWFVLPSTTPAEMFGMAMVEAMASGTPVISTDVPSGVGEVNVDGTTGLVVPRGDAGALAEAMKRLAGSRELRWRLGDAARRRVEEEYTVERMVERHLDLCRRVVDARFVPPGPVGTGSP